MNTFEIQEMKSKPYSLNIDVEMITKYKEIIKTNILKRQTFLLDGEQITVLADDSLNGLLTMINKHREQIKEQQKIIEDLQSQLCYSPNGCQYHPTKEHFELNI